MVEVFVVLTEVALFLPEPSRELIALFGRDFLPPKRSFAMSESSFHVCIILECSAATRGSERSGRACSSAAPMASLVNLIRPDSWSSGVANCAVEKEDMVMVGGAG